MKTGIFLATLLTVTATLTAAHDYNGRIFTIGIYHTLPPYGHVNDKNEHIGIAPTMVRDICDQANADCRIVVASASACWNSAAEEAGPWLIGGLVDACAIYTETAQRKWSLDFTEPVFKNSPVYVFRATNNGLVLPLTSASTTTKIGFLADTWMNEAFLRASAACDEGCDFTGVIGTGVPDLHAQLIAGTIDGYVGRDFGAPVANIEKTPGFELGNPAGGFGSGLMLRKDNLEAKLMLNEGISKYKSSGAYGKTCNAYFNDNHPDSENRCFGGAFSM